MKFSTLFITAALVLTGVQTASALTPPNSIISVGFTQTAATPPAMQAFCTRLASECRTGRTTSTTYNDDLANLLQRVNAHANRATGLTVSHRASDLTDHALTKRNMLIGMGVPASALRIDMTKTRRGEPHAVLIVETDVGDIVLDNLSRPIKTLGKTGYRFSMLNSANPRR